MEALRRYEYAAGGIRLAVRDVGNKRFVEACRATGNISNSLVGD
jgi:hypothetical protein